jgi:hypothetical protein
VNENAQIALAILTDVQETINGGYSQDLVPVHVARAQVYATLATIPSQPDLEDVQDAIYASLTARNADVGLLDAEAAAKAVMGLL